VTAQGHPRARFRRAIEGGWIFHAELAAREAANLSLAEALEFVCLYAEAEPSKFERGALRGTTTNGVRSGNGQVTIPYAQTADLGLSIGASPNPVKMQGGRARPPTRSTTTAPTQPPVS
jgi:hypothetical protein